jgi:hypothetical protein
MAAASFFESAANKKDTAQSLTQLDARKSWGTPKKKSAFYSGLL